MAAGTKRGRVELETLPPGRNELPAGRARGTAPIGGRDSAAGPARRRGRWANGWSVDDIPFVVFDANGVILLANQAAADGLRMSVRDLIGSPMAPLFLHPDLAAQNMSYLSGGRFDAYRVPVVVVLPDGDNITGLGTARVVDVDGERGGVAIFVPDVAVGQFGWRPLQRWIDQVPIAVGRARANWTISAVSRDVSELLGRTPAECIGSSLVGLVHPDDIALLSGPERTSIDSPITQPVVRFASREGEWVHVSVLVAPSTSRASRDPDDTSSIVFALLGRIEDFFAGPSNRLAELERRLRRIGAELKATGLLDSVDMALALDEHPQLGELTSRQWDIVRRLYQGERPATIATAVCLSPSTVRNHLSAIYRKFGVHSQFELLAILRKPQS